MPLAGTIRPCAVLTFSLHRSAGRSRQSTFRCTAACSASARSANGRSVAPFSISSARACGEVIHATKSHHHQAVDRLGEGLVASGWSVLDELVEAIEVPAARWVLGVQWHPEMTEDAGLFTGVVEAARRFASARF